MVISLNSRKKSLYPRRISELLKEMEQIVKQMHENLKVAQDRQKSQTDLKRTPKEFQVGEHVFIKVRSKKSSLRLGSCAKLAPRYCGLFENFI